MKKLMLGILVILISLIIYIYVVQFKDWSLGLKEVSSNIINNTEIYMANKEIFSDLPRGSFLSAGEEMLILENTGCNNKKESYKIEKYEFSGIIRNNMIGKCANFIELEVESHDWFFHRKIILRKFNTTCEIRFSHGEIYLNSLSGDSKVTCWNKTLIPHL